MKNMISPILFFLPIHLLPGTVFAIDTRKSNFLEAGESFAAVTDSPIVVINTWATNGFFLATQKAWKKLSSGASALDAIEYGCNSCEELQEFSSFTCGCDGSVGLGGSPNQNGETTLDAMIMDGNTMNVGSVGALRRIQYAISVARLVLDKTYHTLLVGDEATQFAISQGFKSKSLATTRSGNMWANWLETRIPNYMKDESDHPNMIHDVHGHDTIGMVAIDKNSSIACGTTTNGAGFKIPGRVGDSPIAGAGAYCETGVGGAAATGDGDTLMRFLPTFSAVQYMKQGFNAKTACEMAVEPIRKYYPQASGAVICLKANGEIGGSKIGWSFPFPISVYNSSYSGTILI